MLGPFSFKKVYLAVFIHRIQTFLSATMLRLQINTAVLNKYSNLFVPLQTKAYFVFWARVFSTPTRSKSAAVKKVYKVAAGYDAGKKCQN